MSLGKRKTMLAFGPKGRDNSLDGLNSDRFFGNESTISLNSKKVAWLSSRSFLCQEHSQTVHDLSTDM